jgi:hypothetical protein
VGSNPTPAASSAIVLFMRFPAGPQLLRALVRCRPERRKEAWMSILWIILIVVLVLALLGFFGFR